jgi:glycosyltransferase involved in cell wall biosynthesis
MFTPAKNDQPPRVSVVMGVYRDFRFLTEAIDSVLQQDFSDLELIIVDDGNHRDDIFAPLSTRDPRIRLVRCATNGGHPVALNIGIAAARADIIVRLDQDDICEPTRIGKQVEALDADPDLGLVGSDVLLIAEDGQPQTVVHMPRNDLEVRWTMLFHNPFYHSTATFRRAAFVAAGGYREDVPISEDHFLWFDMLRVCRLRNLAAPLVRYRLNSQGLTALHRNKARNRTHAIREKLWADIGLSYDLQDDTLARAVSAFLREKPVPAALRPAALALIKRVLSAFLASPQATSDLQTVADGRRLAAELGARMQATRDHPTE